MSRRQRKGPGRRIVERHVIVDGRRTRYLAVAAPAEEDTVKVRLPILCIHGLAGSGTVWIRALKEMSRRGEVARVIAADMPGYGESARPRHAMNIEELARWTARLMDALEIERAHIAGNSMGCQVALAFARLFPERAGAMLLTGPTVGECTVPLWRYLLGMVTNSRHEPLIYRFMAMRMFLQMGVRCYWSTVSKMMDDDAVGNAACVESPCLILRGTRDGIVPEESALRLRDALPDGTYQTIANAAHMIPFNHAPEFVRILTGLCAEAENSQSPAPPPPVPETVRVSAHR